MTVQTPVPTLSTQGLVFDPVNKFDTLMADFLAADSKETVLYKGNIFSLSDALAHAGSQKSEIERSMQARFTEYFSRYFASVEVVVNVTEINDSANLLDMAVTILVSDGTGQTQHQKLIKTANKKLQQLIDLKNYGTLPT